MSVAPASARRRLRLEVSGAVQGVGMRPFLYRAASELGLEGWLRNDTRGVTLELEGDTAALTLFRDRLRTTPPPRAVIAELREEWLAAAGLTGLMILPSDPAGERRAAVLPDLAACPACLRDIGIQPAPEEEVDREGRGGGGEAGSGRRASEDRRAGYAFTNCTDCGPRFSIIRALPYDRPNTTMAGFRLCPACRDEYDDPLDRRFHAQPTACPACGPRLRLLDGDGAPTAGEGGDGGLLRRVAGELRAGRIVAVKGLGGFHLVVDATNPDAVAALRARKHRPSKPLAVMVRDVAMARAVCDVPEDALALLSSPEAPVLLLPKRRGSPVAEPVAPGNPCLGLMLPYTPLHHLLMREVDRPVVATSGNLSDEPICIGEEEALERLRGIADLFLVHDRPIERPVDDSVVHLLDGAPRLLRRSRGYAPLPIRLSEPVPPILAVGGQLKNTVALARGRDVFLSQHVGDLESAEARDAFGRVIADLLRLYDVAPAILAHDLHPDYASSGWAVEASAPGGVLEGVGRVAVQHHHAHLAACLAEHGQPGPALGVVWDGAGMGPDGTVWGGEFLLGDAAGLTRVASLRPFRLPGGDAAVKEPRRLALALLHEALGEEWGGRLLATPAGDEFSPVELRTLGRVLETGFRSPWTTSAGRLFDGVAALLGLRQRVGFEGEAAMALEFAADEAETGGYPFVLENADGLRVDWAPALAALLEDRTRGIPVGVAAARFHNGLVGAITEVAAAVGAERVALTGGCFQNRLLTERAARALRARGHTVLLHERVPANDGGLALGQVAVAAATAPQPRGR